MASTTQTGQSGVEGEDNSSGGGQGVRGSSTAGYGVYGISTDGTGVYGTAQANGVYGVYGNSVGGYGVYGVGQLGGVWGDDVNGGNIGVYGTSGTGDAVLGVTSGTGGTGVRGVANGSEGIGVSGISQFDIGVYGEGDEDDGIGVVGTGAGIGVQGNDSLESPFGGPYGTGIGVSAALSNPSNPSAALQAETVGTGSAVAASIDNTSNASPALSATTTGTDPAVLASNAGGPALQVDGVASFSRSGIAKVAGKSTKSARTVKVTGVALTSSSLILATPQGTVSGVAVEGVTPDMSGSSFVITLTKAIAVSLDIAWFVVG